MAVQGCRAGRGPLRRVTVCCGYSTGPLLIVIRRRQMTLIRLIVRHWLALVLVMGLALLFLGGIVWVSRYLGGW